MPTGWEDYMQKWEPDLFSSYNEDEKKRKTISEFQDIVDEDRGLPEPHGVLAGTLDFLSRGNYAAAKAADVLINEEGGILARAWKGLKEGLGEGLRPEERLVFRDVIKRAAPVWSATHQAETELIGFLGDVVVDPINALSAGSGGVLKGAVKIVGKGGKIVPLSRKGVKVFKEIAADIGQAERLTGVRQYQSTLEVMQELVNPTTVAGAAKRAKAPTREQIKLDQRVLASRISKAAEQLPEKSGFFVSDFATIAELETKKKLFPKALYTQDKINEIKQAVKKGDEGAETILDSIIAGSPQVELNPLSASPYLKDVIHYGSKKGRQVGVIIPPKYTKVRMARDQAGISRAFTSSTVDINDLRFVVSDTPEVMNFGQLKNHVSTRVQRESAEAAAKEARLTRAKKTFKELSPSDLIDPGGLKFLGKSVITSEQFTNFARALRLPEIFKSVKDLPGIQELRTVGRGLAESIGLHRVLEREVPEWVRFRRHIEALRHNALEDVEKAYLDIFTVPGQKGTRVLGEKERAEINEFLSQSMKATKDQIKELGLKNPSFEFGQKVFRNLLSTSKLSKEQKAVIVKLQQSYNDMSRLEFQTGLLKSYFVNYSPKRYERIGSFRRYQELRRWQTGQPVKATDTFTQKKRFLTDEEAQLAGYQPIRDAGQLYAMRFLEHQASLRRLEWESYLKKAYPKGIPKTIDKDLVRLGEKYYQPRFGDATRLFIDLHHTITGLFRKSATVVRPAFTTKQIIGNSFQVFAEMGTDAIKAFDPTTMADAGKILTGHGDKIDTFSDVFGIKYTADDVQNLLREFPVRKNVAIENIGFATESDIVRKLTKELYTASHSKSIDSAWQGMEKVFSKGFMYLQIPAYTEDMFRIGAFIGALKAGNDPRVAMEIVDNALFNYTAGLSREEQIIRKAVIPFYSFQKFGTELLIRTFGQHPARLGLSAKGVREVFSVWNKIASGETLTESERNVVPGYLLEQPHVFEKFDEVGGKVKAIFRTFNNMMFMDVVNFMQVDDKTGEIDLQETLVRGGLAQTSPFIKIPLETLVFKRELFTDRALEGTYAGKLPGDVDYDKLVTNLGVMAGLHGGAAGGIAGGALSGLARFGPIENAIKELISWEEGTNKRTGEREVFVNPYMLYATRNLFPAMHTAFKVRENTDGFWDDIFYALAGINTMKLDLKEEGRKQARSAAYELNQKRFEFREYMLQGRLSAADIARQDLMELLEYNQKEAESWLDPEIRGGAVNGGF